MLFGTQLNRVESSQHVSEKAFKLLQWTSLNQTKNSNLSWNPVALKVVPFSVSAVRVWICAYPNIWQSQAFWRGRLRAWIILCSPLPPSHHNHTCLIFSDLSFILANQLPCCTLFHHWLSYDSIIFSVYPPTHISSFLHLYLVVLLLSWHQGQPWPIQAPGLKQISLGLYSSTRIKNS